MNDRNSNNQTQPESANQYNNGRRRLEGPGPAGDAGERLLEGEEAGALEEQKPKSKPDEVTWSSLPARRQLILLTLSRLSEPLVQTSLQVCTEHLSAIDGHTVGIVANTKVPLYRVTCFTN